MIRLENIHLQFGERLLLKEQNLTLSQGQLIIINGPSGCGKTTLLNEIALIGNGSCTYWWDDEKIDHSDEKKKALLRRCQIGYLVQDLEIIDPYLNLEDNLRCMCALADISYDEKRVRSLMQELDLNSYCISRPAATFFLRASGESMNQAGVQNGDLLVVDRAEKPQHGDIVIAEIDGEFTVKRLLLRPRPALEPVSDSPEFRTLYPENICIFGVVTHVIHRTRELR